MSGIRGYVPYKPRADAQHWLDCVWQVLVENKDELPLMMREVFYRLVEDHRLPKTDANFDRVCNIVARARRAHLVSGEGIPFEAIYDGGQSSSQDPTIYDDADDFNRQVEKAARRFRLNRQAGQEQVIELWCEATGWMPLLKEFGVEFSAKVTTGSGYDSTTLRHDLATRTVERAERERVSTVVLHVGDFDPSGENMVAVLSEDVGEMLGQRTEEEPGSWFEVVRVALTEQQIIDLGVETAPPKPKDSRMVQFIRGHRRLVEHLGSTDISAQLEALKRPQLRALLREAIESRFDMAGYREVLAQEAEVRGELMDKLGIDETEDDQ
ncbi:MAG: hypothetical protein M3540_10950 [Actinomycetota bacterium]|nr:hypothetical protein [Actinomycetota bacterium]